MPQQKADLLPQEGIDKQLHKTQTAVGHMHSETKSKAKHKQFTKKEAGKETVIVMPQYLLKNCQHE